MDHPIGELMQTAMSSIKDMVDVNTVIGDPVVATSGATIIPISKVSFGFASGGVWSGETVYYLRQYGWELLAAIPAALPVKRWLQTALTQRQQRGSGSAAVTLALAPKVLAAVLLAASAPQLYLSFLPVFSVLRGGPDCG